jgi:hypothetical protein
VVVAFGRGLSDPGYVEERDVTIDYSRAEGQIDRLPALATDLTRRPVSVIFAGGMDVKTRPAFDPFRKSATPKDISVERAPDVFQMSGLDSYTATS